MTTYTNSYNPADQTQQSFLAALESGEDSSGNPFLGTGGTNLSNAPIGANGFPIWGGIATSDGPSHAAGLFQFQPGTWNDVASQLGLNFQNPSDQAAAAWDLASHNYAAANGGASLEQALASGNYSQVANTLQSTWTSLNPSRLANAFSTNAAPTVNGTPVSGASANPASSTGTLASYLGLTGFENDIVNLFVRGGVFLLAIPIIIIGLWMLADNTSGGKLTPIATRAATEALTA